MLNTAVLMIALTSILLAVGWVLGGLIGMGLALGLAVAINLFSYWYSDRIVLRMYRAVPAEDKRLKDTVYRLAKEFKIPRPGVFLVPSQAPNAFATGRDPKHSAIAVTEGILTLKQDELEGVLAHEMAHIRNRDIMVSSMAATIAGAISFLAQIGYWSLFTTSGRKGEGNLMGIVLIAIFAPLAALLVRLAISRGREYKADQTGAIITRNPRALASALRKISSASARMPMRGNSATCHMWIANPFQRDWFNRLFSSHPPIERRIRRLERMGLE